MTRTNKRRVAVAVVVAVALVVAGLGFWFRIAATRSLEDLTTDTKQGAGLEITAVPGAAPTVAPVEEEEAHDDDDGGGLGPVLASLDVPTADLVTERAVAAAQAWVTQDSLESVAARAVRLSPFFGTGSDVPEGRLPQRPSDGESLVATAGEVGSAAFYNPGGSDVGVTVVLTVQTVVVLGEQQWVDTSTATVLVRLAVVDGEWWPMGISAQ